MVGAAPLRVIASALGAMPIWQRGQQPGQQRGQQSSQQQACVVIACGKGLDAQPCDLSDLVTQALAAATATGTVDTAAGTADTTAAITTAITTTEIRPGRWVGYARLSYASTHTRVSARTRTRTHSAAGSLGCDLDDMARAVVAQLRGAGHSAVLGPPDESHLPGFLNRNRATHIDDELAICFPWAVCEAKSVVEIDPGAAFGAGSHPSTTLAARELAGYLRAGSARGGAEHAAGDALRHPPPLKVLDVGCGSGVLALVAARFWQDMSASSRRDAAIPDATVPGTAIPDIAVHGIDTDPAAIASAKRNAEINGLTQLTEFSADPIARPASLVAGHTYDAIAANIGASTLSQLAPSIAARLAPGGLLVLSGISAAQTSRLEKRYSDLGITFEPPRRLDDWCVLSGTAINPG